MTRSKRQLCCIVVSGLLTVGPAVVAQELDTEAVVAKCIAALGGEANWQAIESVELAGDYESFTQVRPFLIQRQRPNLYRFDHAAGVREVTVAYDGETAWWKTTMSRISQANWPLIAREPYARAIRRDAEIEWPFLNYQERGYHIEFSGEKALELEPLLELQVTLPDDGAIEHWYLDMETFLPTVRISQAAYIGSEGEQQTFFSEYREVAGVSIPHRMEIELGNSFSAIDVREVRINPDIDPKVFLLPLPAGMEKLQTLAGRWKVKVESYDKLTKSWKEETTTAMIDDSSGGSLLVEEIAFTSAGFPREARRLISYDRFRDVFKVIHFDNFTSHVDVLEGGMKGGRVVVSNLSTGTSWELYKLTYQNRETFYEIGDNSFKLERESSNDGGVTWETGYRLTYTRAE